MVCRPSFEASAGPKNLPPAVAQMWEQGIQRVLALPEYQKVYTRAKT
jgi:hypothetical protein